MTTNQTIKAHVGDIFEVSIPETPTTGYVWKPKGIPDGLELSETKFERSRGAGIGGSGVRRLRFVARKSGDYAMVLELRREWEQEAYDQQVVQIEIT